MVQRVRFTDKVNVYIMTISLVIVGTTKVPYHDRNRARQDRQLTA